MKSILLLASLLSIAVAFTDVEYQESFSNWMHTMGKAYTAEEFQTRFSVFKSNMDYVRDWNAGGSSTVLGLTVFADLTNAEYQSIYLGTRFDGTLRLQNAVKEDEPTGPLADTVNWVNKGAVTGIKNQGQCGSCWSFSTTGSTEGVHYLATGNLVSLSEQNLMDCSTAYGNQGCNGGLMDSAFNYIIANGGIDTEASYPYLAYSTPCTYNAANRGATIASYTDVPSGSEAALANAANQQPISVAIDASHNSFQLYTSGIYYESACSPTALDHGVLVVGYGSNGPSTGQDYWLVKNSWGTMWGMDGYIQMSRNRNNNCGIATMASYPHA
jgi:cathepsin L